MTFEEIVDQARAMLQRRGRVAYRTLKRQFQLDEDALEDLKTELIKAQRLAVDEDGEVLVWTGEPGTASPPAPQPARVPLAYTPPYLAEKILTSKTALEGERKQVTVLFADLKGSMELLADRDPEDARQLLDPVLERLMAAVHRYEGTVNQVMGDGIMALFGAPIAHEDHAVRACYAALAMQEAIGRYSAEVRRGHGVEVHIWRPTMGPYIPDDMRALFVRRLNGQGDRNHRDFSNEIQMQHRAIEHDAEKWIRHNPYAFPHEHPPHGYPMTAHEVQKIINDQKPKDWHVSDISETLAIDDIWSLRNSAITLGFTQAELETLIQWRIRALHPLEARRLTEVVAMTLQMREAPGRYQKEWPRVRRSYTAMMAHDLIVAKFGRAHTSLPEEAVLPYLQTVTERIAWQLAALQQFILSAFRSCPAVFARAPVQVSSATYDEAPKREKTQGELIDEMAVAMTQTPRFTAYAKVIHEQDGHQTVLKRKIVTRPLPSLPERPLTDAEGHSPTTIIELNTIRAGLYRPRAQIEQEVRRRREHWRKRPDAEKPPDTTDAPPPTSEPPPTHD
jgi:hypothetical protein